MNPIIDAMLNYYNSCRRFGGNHEEALVISLRAALLEASDADDPINANQSLAWDRLLKAARWGE